LGILVQFVTTPEEISSDIGIVRVLFPPGMALPLHKHADPEIFYLIEGSLEIFQEASTIPPIMEKRNNGWRTFISGEIVSIAGGVIHGVRNSSSEPVMCVIITKNELYSFLHELAHPYSGGEIGPPALNEISELLIVAERHRYWIASPEQNAAVGLILAGEPGARANDG
jgi:quercetin dioxygenase-like cupin family protein